VEDDADTLDLVHEILAGHAYTVLAAGSAADAIRLTDEQDGPIELLTDVVMLRFSGRDLAERLLRARPGTRVLYMSGHGERTLDHHGAGPAVFTMLRKPFTVAELLRAVRGVLQASQPAAADTSAGLGLPKVVVRYATGTS
jgi:two-component system cell cycle sensor histidine kinase/response regulator CckA